MTATSTTAPIYFDAESIRIHFEATPHEAEIGVLSDEALDALGAWAVESFLSDDIVWEAYHRTQPLARIRIDRRPVRTCGGPSPIR